MKSKWIDYKGHRVLDCDYANFKSDFKALEAEVTAVRTITDKEPLNSVLELIEIQNTVISTDVASLFKSAAVGAKPHLRKTAVVGVTGIVNLVAKAVAKFSGLQFTIFDDVESAKAWLVQ
jgi:hypothetical protein